MEISKNSVDEKLHKQLVDYCYPIIGCMHKVHDTLGPGLPEYIYQEALYKKLKNSGYEGVAKEYQHHIEFEGELLESFVKMDMMIPLERGNIVIECKSISKITEKERFQAFGYLRATLFPIAILVNFGTWPKAQIERYYFDRKNMIVHAF
jgi:GxxExxY protein